MKTLAYMIVAALLLVPFSLWAESQSPNQGQEIIYKWKDSDGVVHYSNIRKAGVQAEVLTVVANRAVTAPYEKNEAPPIAQDVTRQGFFALRLAESLKLGTVENESQAESILAAKGIAPEGGWIADYVVTPDILGEIKESVARAADAGEISMSRTEALGAFTELSSEFGLPIQPGSGHEQVKTAEDVAKTAPVEPSVIEEHYYEMGPPVVTYYPPPDDYLYLYGWVPYPFWWYGYFFPGYFILTDFHMSIGHVHRHRHHISRHGRTLLQQVIHQDQKRLHNHRDGFDRPHDRDVISSNFAKSRISRFKKATVFGTRRNIHRDGASGRPHERSASRPHNPGRDSFVMPDSRRHGSRFSGRQVERRDRWPERPSGTLSREREHSHRRSMLRESRGHQGATSSVRIIGSDRGHRHLRGENRISRPQSGNWGMRNFTRGDSPSSYGDTFRRHPGNWRGLSSGHSRGFGHDEFGRGARRDFGRGGGRFMRGGAVKGGR